VSDFTLYKSSVFLNSTLGMTPDMVGNKTIFFYGHFQGILFSFHTYNNTQWKNSVENIFIFNKQKLGLWQKPHSKIKPLIKKSIS